MTAPAARIQNPVVSSPSRLTALPLSSVGPVFPADVVDWETLFHMRIGEVARIMLLRVSRPGNEFAPDFSTSRLEFVGTQY